jgi:hypothetical protein
MALGAGRKDNSVIRTPNSLDRKRPPEGTPAAFVQLAPQVVPMHRENLQSRLVGINSRSADTLREFCGLPDVKLAARILQDAHPEQENWLRR